MIDFLCIGAQKAASTWLFHHLETHPSIAFPPDSAGPYAPKELHFWNCYAHKGINWWLSFFPDRTDGIIQGECTPNYCALPLQQIRLIASLCPCLKIIAILRNPIERSWSAARMLVKPLDNPTRLDIKKYFEFLYCDDCKAISDYESWLKNWRRCFCDEQFYIGFYDMIKSDPRSFMIGIANHLGVSVDHYVRMPDELLMLKQFVGPDLPMPDPIRQSLVHYYTPRIRSLGIYLNKDLSSWIYDYNH